MYAGAILGGYATFQWDAFALCLLTSAIVLCAGCSVGLHRRLIHNSFDCPQWVENCLVYIGVLGSTVGPYSAIEAHDIREWAQAQPICHSYFSRQKSILTDWYWTLHCDIQLDYPPIIRYEPWIAQNGFYQWLEQTLIFQQIPWAIAFYAVGGWSWVFWGIYVRISLCTTIQWLTGYLTHHVGSAPRRSQGIQRYNLPQCGLLTLGEGWQNNHQAFPHSARFSLSPKQFDPGWWLIKALHLVKLAWNIKKVKVIVPIMNKQQSSLPIQPVQPVGQAAATAQPPKVAIE